MIFISIIIYLLTAIVFAVFVFVCMWAFSFVGRGTPFVRTPKKVLPYIDKGLEIVDGSVVYDLGSGDGRILFYLKDKYPNVEFVGIEKKIFPFMLASMRNFFRKTIGISTIRLVRKNFFDHDLNDATHLVMYIYPNDMDDILTKFDNEIKKGTKMVSVSFKFTNKPPTAEVDLERDGKYQNARRLYLYDF
jgi:hypothetical protein